MSWAELTQLARYSLEHAFVDDATKARLLADYERDLAAFTGRYAEGTVAAALTAIDGIDAVAHGYAARTWGFVFTAGD